MMYRQPGNIYLETEKFLDEKLRDLADKYQYERGYAAALDAVLSRLLPKAGDK